MEGQGRIGHLAQSLSLAHHRFVSAWTENDVAFTIDALMEINKSLKEGVLDLTAIPALLEEDDGSGEPEED